jgi:hypothetical protein
MSLRLPIAALRTYDALKQRPGACPRASDARDAETLAEISTRLGQLVSDYRIGCHTAPSGLRYVFWSEVLTQVQAGAFDDLLDRL